MEIKLHELYVSFESFSLYKGILTPVEKKEEENKNIILSNNYVAGGVTK